MSKDAENEFEWPFVTMKHRLIEFTMVVFSDIQKEDYEFQGPFAYLKLHLSDFDQVAFFDAQDVENDSHGLSTPSNITTSTSQMSFFKKSRRQIMSSQGHWPT
jgi:hypothetical protein